MHVGSEQRGVILIGWIQGWIQDASEVAIGLTTFSSKNGKTRLDDEVCFLLLEYTMMVFFLLQ